MKHTLNYLTIGLAILLASCSGESQDNSSKADAPKQVKVESNDSIPLKETSSFINPPLEGVNVAFHTQSLDAAVGGELFYESGSIVSFPPNAFLDANGNVVTGKVEVKYREFNDPVEIFLSGIPMEYDSAGVQYDFESAGMTELLAYSEDTPCFVNPESQPEINMVTNDTRSIHNLYYLDTVSQQWINQGKDEITDVEEANKALKKESKSKDNKSIEEEEPVPPAKPDASKPSFFVTLMPGALPELKSFENVTFEIAKNEKDYKESDSKVAWTSVDVTSNKTEGLYDVTFANSKKSVSYICRPVFKGADYDKAFKLFEAKKAKYDMAKEERVEKEVELLAANKAKDAAFEKENARILKLNKLIEARNVEIEKENARNIKLRKLEEERSEELNGMSNNKESLENDEALNNFLYRSFIVPNFGVWNCDNPNLREGLTLVTTYLDQKEQLVNIQDVNLIYKDFNGSGRYGPVSLTVIPNSQCMIWGIINNRFAYLSYEEFASYSFDEDNPTISFKMKVIDKDVKSPEDIKKYIKL